MSNNSLLISRARSALMARDFNLAERLYKQLLRDEPDKTRHLLRQIHSVQSMNRKKHTVHLRRMAQSR